MRPVVWARAGADAEVTTSAAVTTAAVSAATAEAATAEAATAAAVTVENAIKTELASPQSLDSAPGRVVFMDGPSLWSCPGTPPAGSAVHARLVRTQRLPDLVRRPPPYVQSIDPRQFAVETNGGT